MTGASVEFEEHCINGLAFSSLAALAPRMLVLRLSRRSLSLAPRNASSSCPGRLSPVDLRFRLPRLLRGVRRGFGRLHPVHELVHAHLPRVRWPRRVRIICRWIFTKNTHF